MSEERGPQGETGATGATGEAGMPRNVRRAIVWLFALSVVLAATSILFTVGFIGWQNSHQRATQAKAAIPVCMALQHLARVKGTHGDSGATYGANLQQAFQQVYAATGCPMIMKGKP